MLDWHSIAQSWTFGFIVEEATALFVLTLVVDLPNTPRVPGVAARLQRMQPVEPPPAQLLRRRPGLMVALER